MPGSHHPNLHPSSMKDFLSAQGDGLKFTVRPNAREKSASKKVDDLSRHESDHDAKHEPKPGLQHGAMVEPTSKTSNAASPELIPGQGGKPGHQKH